MRHDPDATRCTLADALDMHLDALTGIRCEASDLENLDIVLTFGAVTVGIEAKVGHSLSTEQIDRESATVDAFVILVKDAEDAAHIADRPAIPVLTWAEVLDRFTDPRVTTDDVNGLRDGKRIARRALNALTLPLNGLPDWCCVTTDGGGGYPGIELTSPPVGADHRRVWIQIQTDRAAPGEKYLVNVGIEVFNSDFIAPATGGWVEYARTLGSTLEHALRGTPGEISLRHGQGRRGTPSGIKIEQAQAAGLPLQYAAGYTDSYLGVRTGLKSASELQATIEAVLPAAELAYRALCDRFSS